MKSNIKTDNSGFKRFIKTQKVISEIYSNPKCKRENAIDIINKAVNGH